MWKPTNRSTVVDKSDLIAATPDYGSNLSVPLGLFTFVEKVTMSNEEEDAEFLSYTFMSEDKNGNFQQKFSVTKFTELHKVPGLIANGKIKTFVGRAENGAVIFVAFNFEEYERVFQEEPEEVEV